MRRRDEAAPGSLARDVVRLAVEHVAPAVIYQLGEAWRAHAQRKHDAKHPPKPQETKP